MTGRHGLYRQAYAMRKQGFLLPAVGVLGAGAVLAGGLSGLADANYREELLKAGRPLRGKDIDAARKAKGLPPRRSREWYELQPYERAEEYKQAHSDELFNGPGGEERWDRWRYIHDLQSQWELGKSSFKPTVENWNWALKGDLNSDKLYNAKTNTELIPVSSPLPRPGKTTPLDVKTMADSDKAEYPV